MTDISTKIRSMLEAFAAELAQAIRADALATVAAAVGGKLSGPGGAHSGKRSVGRPPGPRHKGAKRDPKVLEALTERLGAFVRKNPGQRIEQIGMALGIATKELALPVKKLVAAKRVSTKGQKRATTYWPK